MMAVLKKTLFACVAVLFGLSLGLLLGEAWLRFFTPPWLSRRMGNLNLAWQVQEFGTDAHWSVERSGGRFVRFTPRTQFKMDHYEYNKEAHIDRWGGRVVNGRADWDGEVKVPFLGDSFTFGIGVDDNETFLSLLGAHAPQQFLNLGVPGCALPQQMDILQFRRHDLNNPKLWVFVFYAGNDYFDLLRYYSGGEKKGFTLLEPDSRGLLAVLDNLMFRFPLLGRSYLMVDVEQMLMNRTAKQSEQGGATAWTMVSPNGKKMANSMLLLMDRKNGDVFRREAARLVDRALTRLARLSHEEGFRTIFIVLPDKLQVDPRLLNAKASHFGVDPASLDVELPNRVVDAELEKFNIRYFDVLDCMKGNAGLYYRVDLHFTPSGHAMVARCLQDTLLPAIDKAVK